MEVDDEIFFNTNVFTEFKLAGSPEEIASDEENVRKASSYLADTVLPKFIQDLCSLEVSPMDGQTLTEALHAHGINVRYIGKDQAGNHISGKSSGDQKRWKGASSRKFQPSYMILSSETVWSDVREFAKLKYQFELPEDAKDQVKKVSVLRNLCQKMGITVAANKYDLNAATPFQASDILDLLPVVKHFVPVCTEAKDLVETGKVQLAEDFKGIVICIIASSGIVEDCDINSFLYIFRQMAKYTIPRLYQRHCCILYCQFFAY